MAFERIRTRRDTTAAWAMTNPVLGLGELGIDVTLQKVKAGDGLRPWNELPFLSETDIVNVLDSTRTDAALSAAMGKALNQALGAVTQNLDGLQGALAGKLCKGSKTILLGLWRSSVFLCDALRHKGLRRVFARLFLPGFASGILDLLQGRFKGIFQSPICRRGQTSCRRSRLPNPSSLKSRNMTMNPEEVRQRPRGFYVLSARSRYGTLRNVRSTLS